MYATDAVCGAEWSLKVLKNYHNADPLDVDIAIEYACGCLRREIDEAPNDRANVDEILEEALRAHRDGDAP